MPAFFACKSTSALIVSLSLASLVSAARADMIGINFVGANNGGGASVSGAAGAISQSNWNNAPGNGASDASLILSTGADSGATLFYSANDDWATGSAGASQNSNLLLGYLDDLPTRPTSVTVDNLPSSIAGVGATPYDVYIYIAGDTAGRGGDYTVNGTTAVLVNSGPEADGNLLLATPGTDDSGTGAVAGNYYEFTNVTGTNLSISTTPTIGGDNERSPINGIQIVAAPEPASLATLALAALPFLARRRRKNQPQ